jgi:hypothetical protein
MSVYLHLTVLLLGICLHSSLSKCLPLSTHIVLFVSICSFSQLISNSKYDTNQCKMKHVAIGRKINFKPCTNEHNSLILKPKFKLKHWTHDYRHTNNTDEYYTASGWHLLLNCFGRPNRSTVNDLDSRLFIVMCVRRVV